MKPSASRFLNTIFLCCFVVALILLVDVSFAFGNTITVTSTADSGAGSLRAAIASASSGDTINFGVTGTITLTTGQLTIGENLRINGPGISQLTISGNINTLVSIGTGITVAISGLTTSDGNPNDTGEDIYNAGTLLLSNVSITGGSHGIYNDTGGTLIVTNSTISGNNAYNGSVSFGGGIYNNSGAVATLTNTSVAGNKGDAGAGIFNYGVMTITDSAVSGNDIVCCGLGVGAGIFNAGGSLSVNNSTVADNAGGFGIWNGLPLYAGYSFPGGPIVISNSTIFGNGAGIDNATSASTTLKDTILAGEGGQNCSSNGGSFVSDGYNLVDDNSCALTGTGDLNSTPAGLDPTGLQNNGGATPTIALLATSAAVDAVPLNPTNYCTDANGASVSTDQRGVTRPQGIACDIGAFELAINPQYSQLNGGNTFNGSQTVNGNVTASNFVGNGTGLTNVTASLVNCAGCVGNSQLSINYAGSASQGGSANNAVMLGGLLPSAFQPAGSYATTGANLFSGDQNIVGNLSATGTLTGGGLVLPSTGTATASQGFNSGAFDTLASVFNSTANAAQNQLFRWQAEPASNNSANPTATLNLLFGSNGATLSETGLRVNANGTINFATGQTFPGAGGSGTISGVTAGTGLSGGGSSGNVTLSLASNSCAAGSALTALPFTCAPFAGLGPNVFSGNQTVGGTVTATAFSGDGSALTNVNAATAAMAASATNALALGGQPPSFYATTAANTFTGSQTITSGNLALDNTNGAGTTGVITLGGNPFLHDFGTFNTFLGDSAGNFSMTGQSNTGVGVSALQDISNGNNNTALGYVALPRNTTGSNNTAEGYGALEFSTTGSNNTATGFWAGLTTNTNNGNTAGSANTFIGSYSGPGVASNLQNATAIGANAIVSASNALVLGSINGVNGASSNVNVGIGTATPGYTLDVEGGQVNASGGFCIAGVCQTNWPSTIGTITGVTAGTGLTGGGTSGNVPLSVNGSVVAFQSDLANGVTTAEAFAASAANNAVTTSENFANSTFLPLAGGTLTGNLSGTGATFSGTAAANQVNAVNDYLLGGTPILNASVPGYGGPSIGDIGGTVSVGLGSGPVYGFRNTYVGYDAGEDQPASGNDSSNNTFVGSYAGAGSTSGFTNSFFGASAGSGTTGYQNVFLGYAAGSGVTTGSNNTIVGTFAGGISGPLTGSQNIYIGEGINPPLSEGNAIRIGVSGTQTAAYVAGVYGGATSSGLPVFVDSTGHLGTGGGSVLGEIPAGGVTNAMLANPSLTLAAGPGVTVTGGSPVSLGGTATVSLATNTCAAGSAFTALPFTCSPFAGLAANTFTGMQTMPALTVSATGQFGSVSSNSNAVEGITSNATSVIGVTGSGVGVDGAGDSGLGVLGTSQSNYGAEGDSTSSSGVYGSTASSATNTSAGLFNNTAATNAGNILLGQYNGTNEFTVDAKGDVTANGLATVAGDLLPSTGTATASQGFNSNALESVASVFNSSAGAAQNQMFLWQAEPKTGTNDTANPSATMNLLFGANGATPSETGLSLNANGTLNFATGQTFPGTGAGTITGITAGSGLSGGGSSGNVSLSIPSAGVTNAMLANPSLTIAAGTGGGLTVTGGSPVALGGTTTVSLTSQACATGSAVTAHPFTCSPFATLAANTFTGAQTMPTLSVSGNATVAGAGAFGSASLTSNALLGTSSSGVGVVGTSTSNVGVEGVSSTGFGVSGGSASNAGVYGTSGSSFGVEGISNSYVGVFGQSVYSTGVDAYSTSGDGLYAMTYTTNTATTAAAGVFNNVQTTNPGNILLGQYQGANEFVVDAHGDVTGLGVAQFPSYSVSGTAPTCSFTTGGGASPSCTLDTGSTNSAGIIIATTGTGAPAGTGTITLTFSGTFGTANAVCLYEASDDGTGTWNGLAVMKDKTPSTANDVFTWTNGATPTVLTASKTYHINYHCFAK